VSPFFRALVIAVTATVMLSASGVRAQWIGAGAGGTGTDFNDTANWTSGSINGSFLNNTTSSTVSLSTSHTLSGSLSVFSTTGIQPTVLTLNGTPGGAAEVLTLGGNVTLNKSAALSPSITATWSTNSTTINVSSASGLVVGQQVSDNNLRPGTTITAISGTTVTLSMSTPNSRTSQAVTVGSGLFFGSDMTLDLGDASRTFSASGGSGATNGAITIHSLVSGSGGLVASGVAGSAVNLTNAANTFTGNVTVQGGGVLNFSSAGALGSGTAKVIQNSGSLLYYTGSSAVVIEQRLESGGTAFVANQATGGAGSSITLAGPVNVSGGTLILGANQAQSQNALPLNEISGVISGGGIVDVRTLWRFSNNSSTHSGSLVVGRGGTLEFTSIGNVGGGPSALGAPTTTANGIIQVGNQGTWALRYTGDGSTSDRLVRNSNGSAGSILANGSGPLVLTTGFTYDNGLTGAASIVLGGTSGKANAIGPLTFNYSSSGSNGNATVTKSDAGLWVLTGSNSYNLSGSGTAGTYTTVLNNGVLRLANANAIPGGIGTAGGASRLFIAGGVLELAAGDFTRDTATTASDTTVQLASGGFSAFGGNRAVNFGAAAAAKTWGANGFITGTSTMLLSSAAADSTIDLQNPIVLGSSGTATRTFLVSNGAAAVDAMLSGALTSGGGTQGIVKAGAGVLAMTGTSTYSGLTNVSEGTLLMNGRLTNSSVVVASGATIGGSGQIDSLLSVLSGGILAPGNSPGLLTVGDLSLAAGSTSQFEITGAIRGSEYDAIDVLNSMTYGGSLALNFTTTFADNTSFLLFSLPGTPADSFTSVTATGSYGTLTFTKAGGVWSSGATAVGGQTLEFAEGSGTLIIVPEPTTLVLVAIGMGLMLARRQRSGRR
jgi:fibronectin-binding autotransporter adhesin